ncbi:MULTISPECIES: acyl-CoA dehydrogenase [unclassified Sphingobacterium]|uniref:acyl-CoA dehydrogenase n=1 Tax=unclassified Sphingobacterium TaxID=2609468 RepID=UPI0025F5B406|nr:MULTISPECIES: acyl-CoA dehydrogenase [unclassified Sphingobacterium]
MKKNMQLTDAAIAVLKDQQRNGIQQKSLSDEQLELIYRNKWFKIWVPQSLNGLGLDLVGGLSLLKELAYWDGGLAWTVTLCAGANLFVGFIDPAVGQDIFTSKKVCFGGSGQIAGIAEREGKSYRLKGLWKYATGAPHLTHFTLNAYIQEDGQQLLDEGGNPLVKSFFVAREFVLIHYDWDTFGLEATASHSFSLDNIRVDEKQSFFIDASKSTGTELLYQYPFMPFAELTLLVNFMGMYHRFLDLIEKLFVLKSNRGKWEQMESKAAFRMLDEMQQDYIESAHSVMDLAARSWENLKNELDNSSLYARIAIESRNFVETILSNVIKLYPHTGIAGAEADSEINILFRNIFTASQHKLLQKGFSQT